MFLICYVTLVQIVVCSSLKYEQIHVLDINFIIISPADALNLNMQGLSELSRFNEVNIMVADALAPWVATSSAPMILTM